MTWLARLAGTTVSMLTLAAGIVLTQGPTFEVAAIKENKSGSSVSGVQASPGGRITATNMTLVRIIGNAYGNPAPLQAFQVATPPESWMNTDRFDIIAKGADGTTPEDRRLMLQALLRDRFKLVMHREAHPMSVLVLRLARSDGRLGPKLKPTTLNCLSPEDKSKCGYRTGGGVMSAGAVRMSQLAMALTPLLREILIDQTNLDGQYDFELMYSGAGRAGQPDSEHPPLPVALEEQLGLKLSSERAPVDVWVIDSAQKPVPD